VSRIGFLKANIFLTTLLTVSVFLSACGKNKSKSSDSPGSGIPDYIANPPLYSPVPVGSKDVAAFPPSSEVAGTLLLRLMSEPSAKVFYSFKDPGENPDTASMTEVIEPLLLLPPLSIWVVASLDGGLGPLRRFDYTIAKDLFDPASTFEMQRLPPLSFKQVPLANSVDFVRYPADAKVVRKSIKNAPDGTTSGWPGSGRYMMSDGLYDVPDALGAIDISWAQTNVTADKIEFLLAMRDKPKIAEGTVYGFDIGDSGINFASFGKGTKFHYRVELNKAALGIIDKGTNEQLPKSATSAVVAQEVVEFSIDLNDLPLLIGLKNIVIRPFAYDLNEDVMISDRIEPYIVQTEFAVDRAVVTTGDKKVWEINFLMDPAIAPASLSGKYLSLSGPMIDDLEKMNQIPFYSRGSLQLFFVDKDENGYAGLNTSDRGLLTTLGQQTSIISKAQLLAHEYAHYQNARNSGINERWIQEGMSEWSAERYLYRHFPKRAVYKFMRRLRYDRYFESTGDKLDKFPLVTWSSDASTVGYEKSLMFTNLLEKAIGHKNLIKIYQIGVNAPIQTKELKVLAEQLSGKDLTDLFSFWVYDGAVDADWDPFVLFKDSDGDGLMTLDEMTLGTHNALSDSDSDGFPDGEEYFRGMDPLVSLIDPKGTLVGQNVAVLVNADDKDTMALGRIGGEKGSEFFYSFDPMNTAPDLPYQKPLFFRPPYTLTLQSKNSGDLGAVRSVTRDLYVSGAKVSPTFSADVILPPTPSAAKLFLNDIVSYNSIGSPDTVTKLTDNPNDLPEFLGSLDITALSSTETEGTLTFTIETRLTPDPYGQFGDIFLSFDVTDWDPSGPDVRRVNSLTMNAGAPFWHVVKNNVESAQLINSGVDFVYGKDLKITVNKSLLTAWLAATGERQVCIQSNIEIEHASKFKDRAGCIVFTHPSYQRLIGSADDQFGIGKHQIDVFYNEAASSSSQLNNAVSLGLSAIVAFEDVLQRPLFDRSYWPIHLSKYAITDTYGSSTTRSGAWLTVESGLEDHRFDYLVVEQLARLVTTDLLERSSGVPFWMQEFFAQWLTSAALHKIYPTKDVHDFHYLRIRDFNCFVDGVFSCSNYFSGDIPIANWNSVTVNSTGSVKSLMFALYLDATLGSDVMAKAFGPWFSTIPSSDGMKAILKGYAPAAASHIEDVFSTWVVGTNNPAADTAEVRANFLDADSDKLFLFEETKLGFDPAVRNDGDDYLN
jgi:hypothetical protein